MSIENKFEVATRNKVRFPFRGQISVEDLWDLNVQNLDSVFKTLNSQVKQAKEESLLNTKTKEDEALDLQIEIVKYIVQVKLEEDANRLKVKENREKKQKLYSILAAKQEADLQNKSTEELQKMIDELDA
jgi:predicted nucleic acid binding AN1-type Zn finger protein